MTCIIEIGNKTDGESEAIAAALKKANQYIPHAQRIQICCRPRWPASCSQPGWLEYQMVILFDNGSTLFLLMVQRKPDAEFEFHS